MSTSKYTANRWTDPATGQAFLKINIRCGCGERHAVIVDGQPETPQALDAVARGLTHQAEPPTRDKGSFRG